MFLRIYDHVKCVSQKKGGEGELRALLRYLDLAHEEEWLFSLDAHIDS
jgi:hypothetical protein